MRCLAKLPWKVGLFVALGCCASYLFFGGAGLQSRRDDLAAAAVVSWKKYLEIGGGGPAALGEPTCDGDLVIIDFGVYTGDAPDPRYLLSLEAMLRALWSFDVAVILLNVGMWCRGASGLGARFASGARVAAASAHERPSPQLALDVG